ncbi:septum formation protein [Caminicella sporogenes DSM 14501]|uniref:dTTP/UTP pyrophosphatase n=1 Tax=Caminicella sporogenes DSM 14501 TaxID=1121266 RepID=A0A1M6LWL2_9FIRM|nr:Maf family protein [Caminicella sporogenes]RKD27980.1 septum formation protein Maf [Caminicella sporogenes]SHJ75654.1 septum formation protein [Caminicella sporogenes DSM 14501]
MNKIILASSSPRRREILKNIGLKFDIVKADIEEKVRTDEKPEQIVMALAFEKAINIANKIEKDFIIIAADTIVYKDRVLGKPKNFEEAYEMLKLLEDDIHYVYTGIAVIKAGSHKKVVDFEKTKVKIKKLTDEKIKRYIETGEVWDKAGAYAIQGFGSLIVEWIEGDYFNVVGLPISKLDKILHEHFNISIL